VSRHEQTDANVDGRADGRIALQLLLDDKALKTIIEAVEERVLAHLAERDGDGWPEWMSVPKAAEYLCCSEERIRKLIARGTLPSYSEGRGCRVFLNRVELDEAMRRWREPRAR
jgi:excisionase family DNA binding protein